MTQPAFELHAAVGLEELVSEETPAPQPDEQRWTAARILLASLGLLLGALAIWSIVFPKRIDFAVYWYDVRAHFREGLPLYGAHSAFGAPMIFRYPPAFAILFYPFTLLPFSMAAGLWALLEAATITMVARWMYRRFDLHIRLRAGCAVLILCAPYFYFSFKDGNMQWFVFALTLLAILFAEDRPWMAGFALALGIAVKVWPLCFLPLLLIPGRRKALVKLMAWSVALWTLPVLVFGWGQYRQLLQQWFHQEYVTNAGAMDIWYPSQSLRGVLLRYFTDPRVTLPYRLQFRDVHLLEMSPALIVGAWMVVSLVVFAVIFYRLYWDRGRARAQLDLIYFLAFSALQPFCHWSSLVTIAPAALLAGHLFSQGRQQQTRMRFFFLATLVLCCIEYGVSFSRSYTRFSEAAGIQFAIMLTLGGSIVNFGGVSSKRG